MIKNRDKVESVDFDQQCLKLDKIQCNLIKGHSTSPSCTSNGTCGQQSLIVNSISEVSIISTSAAKIENTIESTEESFCCLNFQQQIKMEVQEKESMKSTPIRPLVFCGPSGSGKSTMLKKLLQEYRDCFGFSISHTTRNPRNGEVNGKDYYFVSREEILTAIANDEFIEYAEFAGNIYGTSKKAVRDVQNSLKICILDIDIEGVKSIKKTDIDPVYIFIMPPSIPILEERLRKRGSETEEKIQMRLKRAVDENAYGRIEGNFDILIVNDVFEKAYEKLRLFVESKYSVIRSEELPTPSGVDTEIEKQPITSIVKNNISADNAKTDKTVCPDTKVSSCNVTERNE